MKQAYIDVKAKKGNGEDVVTSACKKKRFKKIANNSFGAARNKRL